jgi:uncharacterized membrane protein YedE/YeeE
MNAIFPLAFATEEFRLLTAIVLGFLFGFTLERAGFGNARKLAAQFYGYDLTVFKVMFTAILVAMVGVYGLANMGLVDLSLLWINPTFLPAQIIGGFLLGAGFIMSGLCPGTSVVSAASGRWDAVATIVGIFVGTGIFVVAVAVFPPLESLYHAGEMGVSVLPTVLGVPPLAFAFGVVVMAGLAFVGAERVEMHFATRNEEIECAPRSRPRAKLATAFAVAGVALLALGLGGASTAPAAPALNSVAPRDLADRIIGRDPTLMMVDVRSGEPDGHIPGAYPMDLDAAASLLAGAPAGTRVVVIDEVGDFSEVPSSWPRRLSYAVLAGGFVQWEFEVLTPALPGDGRVAEREWAARQNQIAAFFSGAAVEGGAAPPPPPMPAGGPAGKKKKAGGC